MAATMGLYEWATGTYTASTGGNNVAAGNIYFRSTNTLSSAGTSSSDPVTKPASNTQNSYQKYLHPRASGTYATVGNTYAYVQSTSLSTGVSLYAMATNPYTGGTPGASGFTTPVVLAYTDNASHTLMATAPSTNTVAVGNAKSLHVGNTGTVGPNATADVGDWLVLWMAVASTASAGTMGSTVIVIQWDET